MHVPALVRLLASVIAVALLVLEVGPAAYGADPTYPTGTFTLDRNTTYALHPTGAFSAPIRRWRSRDATSRTTRRIRTTS